MWFEILFYTILFIGSLLASIILYRKLNWDKLDRLGLALLIPMSVAVTTLLIFKVRWSIFYDHSWERLQNAFALSIGYPIYHSLNSGAVLNTIYGPVSFIALQPATLFDSPTIAMRVAVVIFMAFFFLPPLGLILMDPPESFRLVKKGPLTQQEKLYRLLIFFCFCFFPFLISPLRASGFNIHVDAPTLGLGALACAVLYFRKDREAWPAFWGSAILGVLTVWSKQVAVPLLVALPLYLWVADGRRAFIRYSICVLISSLVISAGFFIYFNPENVLFNILTIPSKHPLRDGGSFGALMKSSLRLLRECLMLLAVAHFSLRPLIFQKSSGLIDWIKRDRGAMFLWVGFFMIPLSLLGSLKVGGSNNTLSYACYFFLIAVTVGLKGVYDNKTSRIAVLFLALVFLFIQIPSVYYRIIKEQGKTNYAEVVYKYIKEHPGEAFFPRLGVLNIMAEKKVYHASVALMDRKWADMPVSQEHLRAHIPEKMRLMAFRDGRDDDKQWIDLKEFWFITKEPGLPGFYVYKTERD